MKVRATAMALSAMRATTGVRNRGLTAAAQRKNRPSFAMA